MTSSRALLCTALLLAALSATVAADRAVDSRSDAELSRGGSRKLLGTAVSGGYNGASQAGFNFASGFDQLNQANVNQNAQAVGNQATAANEAYIKQTNNGVAGQSQANQANINQNAQATGYDATASNKAYISQTNNGGSEQANQASIHSNAEAVGEHSATASSEAAVESTNNSGR